MFQIIQRILKRHNRQRRTAGSHQAALGDQVQETQSGEPLLDDFAASQSQSDKVHSLVDSMLQNQRYALLLRPQIANNLDREQYQLARNALEENMGLVPTGTVYLEPSLFDVDFPLFAAENPELPQEFTVLVQSVFLDRYLVTNAQFQQFVDAGGYQEIAIWDQEVWPAVLDFTDESGHAGPRFWKNGRYRTGEGKLPVVGISWYEAAAYARWIGKRLPTDAEWVKAGSWPVTLSPGAHLQRKYPWGDTFDHQKANVWGSQPRRIVAVDEFSDGVSVGGLYQLIGNAWEWTASTLETNPEAEEDLHGHAPLLKSIRGGAFDTYFEHQATCQFASGENPILRKHNIGFRCALGACDIADPFGQMPLDVDADEHEHLPDASEDETAHAAHDLAHDEQPVEETLA
jgi:gamma-glutamyl hercynylcysteine S-oxide synthase